MSVATLPWGSRGAATSLSTRSRVVYRGHKLGWNESSLASREVVLTGNVALLSDFPLTERLRPVLDRIAKLGEHGVNWDSYGGLPLQWQVVPPLLTLLRELDEVIGSSPALSLTGEGGLLVSWKSSEASLELSVEPPRGSLEVYYQASTGAEWEGPVVECQSLDKWVWQASGAA